MTIRYGGPSINERLSSLSHASLPSTVFRVLEQDTKHHPADVEDRNDGYLQRLEEGLN